jgi:hypothetical protein
MAPSVIVLCFALKIKWGWQGGENVNIGVSAGLRLLFSPLVNYSLLVGSE